MIENITIYLKVRYNRPITERFKNHDHSGKIILFNSNYETCNVYFDDIKNIIDEEDRYCMIMSLKNATIESDITKWKDHIKAKLGSFSIYKLDDIFIKPEAIETFLIDLGDKFLDLSGSLELDKENRNGKRVIQLSRQN